MRHSFVLVIVIGCCTFTTSAAAHPASKTEHGDSRAYVANDNYHTLYRPPLRQGHVLYVEDPGNDGFGPFIKPDPVWDTVLINLLGTGHYGWYGPIIGLDEDGPSLDTMLQYDLVVWNTYDYWWSDTAALTQNDQNAIGSYLESGGKVWLIGQDLLWSGVPLEWTATYFHVTDANQDYVAADSLPVLGLNEINGFSLWTVSDYQLNLFYPDELIPDSQAHAVLEETDSNRVVGIFYPGTDWKSAFWTIDGRITNPSVSWLEMVNGMFNAFEVPGITETPVHMAAESIDLAVSPQPVTRSAIIRYTLPVSAHCRLRIFNAAGQLVANLVDGYTNAGAHVLPWHGEDGHGCAVPQGVYYLQLIFKNLSSTIPVIVVR